MRPLLSLLIICQVFFQPLFAQEEFVAPPARLLTKIPFKLLTGGVIILRATLNDFQDSLTFILDTGSGGISLDSTTAVNLGIKTEMSDRTIRGIAGIRQVRFTYNNRLHMRGITLDSLNFHINDYEVLTSAYGEKIDGIIGYSFLSRYLVTLDYDSLNIGVFSKGLYKYPKGGYLMRPTLVNIPVVNGQIRDDREVLNRFYFDTGAGMCILLSADFVNDSSFLRTKRKWYKTQAEGLGGKAAMKMGVVRQVKVGPFKFKNVPAYVFEDDYNVTSYPYLGGLIGNDLLRRFNVVLNYDKREIHLVPNTHFRDIFDYSYTGLGMYLVDQAITVVDVMAGSPAEEAGFHPGDVVVSINNNFSGNIQQYKTMLQNSGEKLRFVLMRPDGLVELYLKVKSIL
ncbi:MAG TPA: aspartyl protease family protein [Flavitalea sp.]|nr:aspartyl protease family protein [Flavitalea sp.]